jgi:hypothetical protein
MFRGFADGITRNAERINDHFVRGGAYVKKMYQMLLAGCRASFNALRLR